MKWTPHNYQLNTISLGIVNRSLGMFLDPGLGKTSTTLSIINILSNAGLISGTLIVAPLEVCYSTWPDEISKWDNFKNISYTILHEDNKNSVWDKHNVYLINPEGMKWLHAELLDGLTKGKRLPFKCLVLDESTLFKNHKSNRFKYVKDMLPLFTRRYLLTGTPSPKNLLNLWSQMYILDNGARLGNSFYKFRKKYFVRDSYDEYNWIIKEGAKEEIYNAIGDIILDLSAQDNLTLPPIIYNTIKIKLSKPHLSYYKEMERDLFLKLDNLEASAQAAADKSMKCHQIANGRVYEDIPEGLDDSEIREFKKTRKVITVHHEKCKALLNLIYELNGKPLLVSYYFKHDKDNIVRHLGYDVPYIGSGVSKERSRELQAQWNRGELPVLLLHPNSAAYGLNLQASGNDICWYSLTWNLEHYIQLNARLYRQGVKGSVRIHHLCTRSTTDEVMLKRLGERARDQIDLRVALREYRKTLLEANRV